MRTGRHCRRCGAILRYANDGDRCDPCARIGGAVELPPDFYAKPEVVAALSVYDFGKFFRLARAALGLTQEQFGLFVGLAQSRVCKVENGAVRLRDIATIANVAAALGIPAELLAFARAARHDTDTAVAFAVAIAVVLTETHVLMVCRRDPDPSGITWQFPAGVIKPGASADAVAVREVLAETGVHCAVRSRLGSRIHPLTGVACEYFLCDFLTGTPENRDMLENVDARWVPRREVTRFVRAEVTFGPVVAALALRQGRRSA